MRLSRLRKDASLLAFGAKLWSAAACCRFAASQLAGWTGHVPQRGTISLAVDETHGKEAPKIRFRPRRGRTVRSAIGCRGGSRTAPTFHGPELLGS